MNVRITEAVDWVGKLDWELRRFHGQEYSTFKGTSYNSYLIRDRKTAVFDTVWGPYGQEYVENLARLIDLESIDYVIAAHAEVDHSGALPDLMDRIPDTPVICTANGVKSLTGYYHRDWNFQVVKTGDSISLGDRDLVFVTAPMLHWPDTLFAYLTGDNVLFSQDAFGHHYASEMMFNDLVDRAELYEQCLKYYANILTPFNRLVENKIKEVVGLGLPVDFICPSHGVIWREEPLQIVHKYLEWAADYAEDQVTVFYDTMWDSTLRMAEAMAEGLHQGSPATAIKLLNTAKRDKNDIITEIFKSKMIVAGSPTINRGILSSMAAMLEMIKGLQFKGKKAAAFGSYGWSGESPGLIHDWLSESGFEIVAEPLKVNWRPDGQAVETCRDYGRKLAESL